MTQINGWLNIYKPIGISSARAVSIVKRKLGCKVGHAGTLDVEAEGVLPLALGEATKLMSVLMSAKKEYIFTIEFGVKTDTGDKAGKTIETTKRIPNKVECIRVCGKFIGEITQVPPAFSALKINGVRSYDLAREGKAVKLKERKIEVFSLQCIAFSGNTATYKVQCSKGTYIRTLAEDIALCLQSLGFVLELCRSKVGIFYETDALHIADIDKQSKEFIENNILRVEDILDDILVLEADVLQAKMIKNGVTCLFPSNHDYDFLWIRHNKTLLAIGSLKNGYFSSQRVFNL